MPQQEIMNTLETKKWNSQQRERKYTRGQNRNFELSIKQ